MIQVGATHIMVKGYRAVVVDEVSPGVYDAQIILREGIGPVIRGVENPVVADTDFDINQMPVSVDASVAGLPTKVGMFRKILNVVTFKKA